MLREQPTYSDGKNTVVFYRIDDGCFSHKVVVNGFHLNDAGRRMFLAKEHRPSIKTVTYFLSICESKLIQ